jgi:hypothetical protein
MMKLLILVFLLLGGAVAQQQATLAGIIKTETDIPESTHVAIHLVDNDNIWLREIATVLPVAGTFSIATAAINPGELFDFKSGSILFPDLINEYDVAPADVKYARALVSVYVDYNGNGIFDNTAVDKPLLGVVSLEEPVGFFTLVYVDKDATLTGKGTTLNFKQGWNIFTVRYPEGSTVYEVRPAVDDLIIDAFF